MVACAHRLAHPNPDCCCCCCCCCRWGLCLVCGCPNQLLWWHSFVADGSIVDVTNNEDDGAATARPSNSEMARRSSSRSLVSKKPAADGTAAGGGTRRRRKRRSSMLGFLTSEEGGEDPKVLAAWKAITHPENGMVYVRVCLLFTLFVFSVSTFGVSRWLVVDACRVWMCGCAASISTPSRKSSSGRSQTGFRMPHFLRTGRSASILSYQAFRTSQQPAVACRVCPCCVHAAHVHPCVTHGLRAPPQPHHHHPQLTTPTPTAVEQVLPQHSHRRTAVATPLSRRGSHPDFLGGNVGRSGVQVCPPQVHPHQQFPFQTQQRPPLQHIREEEAPQVPKVHVCWPLFLQSCCRRRRSCRSGGSRTQPDVGAGASSFSNSGSNSGSLPSPSPSSSPSRGGVECRGHGYRDGGREWCRGFV